MELSAETEQGVDLSGYKTPIGKLARRFKASVELWKARYHELKRERKRFQNRAADAQRSRDHWKALAQQWQDTVVQQFDRTVAVWTTAAQLQAELEGLREETAVGEKKK